MPPLGGSRVWRTRKGPQPVTEIRRQGWPQEIAQELSLVRLGCLAGEPFEVGEEYFAYLAWKRALGNRLLDEDARGDARTGLTTERCPLCLEIIAVRPPSHPSDFRESRARWLCPRDWQRLPKSVRHAVLAARGMPYESDQYLD